MKKVPKIIKFLLLFLAFISSAVWYLYFTGQDKYFSINFYNVGSGDAALIKTPDNFKIMVDGGPSTRVLENLGRSLGSVDRKIDLLILTHPHEDHAFGALEILKKYDVGMILGTGVIHTSDAYLNFLEQIKKKNIKFVVAEQGQIFKFSDLELEVFYPFEKMDGKKTENLNNSSIVFMAKYKKFKTLFLGDAEKEVGEKLLKTNFDLTASVVKIAHQGSKNGCQNMPGLLEKINPQIAVILVGENKYGHPHKETLENLGKHKIKTLRTDKDSKNGSVKIESDGEKFGINPDRK